MYGDAGYLYVMLYAGYLSAQGRRVLVVDRSEGKNIHSRLPLPKEPLDCLYYQGVDYLLTTPQALLPYDICLCYWGETDGSRSRDVYQRVVFADCSKPRLEWGVDLALQQDALLVIVGVPEYGCVKKLLCRKQIRFPEERFVELPWKLRDAKVLLALEHGMRVTFHRLSKELKHLLRYLSEMGKEEVECDDCGLLE